MARRILVLSASVGAGHLRAAEAVELALRQTLPDATVRQCRCAGNDQSPLPNASTAQFYLDLVNKAPHALGYFYDLLDQPRLQQARAATGFGSISKSSTCRPFVKFLQVGAVGPGHQHAFSAGGDHRVAASRRSEIEFAAGDGDHRFRDASPVGQSAVRSLLHRDGGGGALSATLGRAGARILRHRHSDSSRLQHAEGQGRPASPSTAWRATARSSCNSPAASASARSRKSSTACSSVEQPIQLVTITGRNEKLKSTSARSRRRLGTRSRCWASRRRSTN